MDNEELLRIGGECPQPNCIEVAGHTGPCSGALSYGALRAQVARLKAELADEKGITDIAIREMERAEGERNGFEQTMQDNADVARKWEAANAAKAAALRDLEWSGRSRIRECPFCEAPGPQGKHRPGCVWVAALSDEGDGWLPGGLDREATREGVKAMKEGRITPWEDVERELVVRNLFQTGNFTLHSGEQSFWKIDCDALTDEDIATLAKLVWQRIPYFGAVEGVPTGGLRLAKALERYKTKGPLLIVDDVFTTGESIEAHRAGRPAVSFVVFARQPPPFTVKALFTCARP